MTEAAPSVLVWRETVLPESETFIKHHVEGLQRWQAELVGLYAAPRSLPVARTVVGAAGLDRLDRMAVLAGRFAPLRAYLRDSPPDLVHAHFGTDAAVLLPYLRNVSAPLVVTFHGQDVTRRGGSAVRRLLVSRYRALFDRADRLIAVSDFIAARLLDLGAPPDKVQTRYLGSPARPQPDEGRVRSGVLFVGRLVEKKGLLDLIRAMAGVRRTCAASLTVIGDGPLRAEGERRADQLGIAVRWLGSQDIDRVRAEMESAALLCGPSRTAADGDAEGLGQVFVEAAQAALPVVGYVHGGVPEVVVDGRTGRLVPEGDVGALSDALVALLSDPQLARAYGRAGLETVAQRFDIRRRTAELEELYDTLLPGSTAT
jgi:colanic acid/amylovoran biosynthesis glycosyltransferase